VRSEGCWPKEPMTVGWLKKFKGRGRWGGKDEGHCERPLGGGGGRGYSFQWCVMTQGG